MLGYTREDGLYAAASDGLRKALAGYGADGSDAQQAKVADAVRDMRAATLPHLEHEEREAMFFDALRKVRSGMVVCVFDGPLRHSHRESGSR